MKKKQLLVFIMAGSLATGMSPVTMAFAEADTQTVTIEDTVAVAAESEEGEAAAEPVQDISDTAADTPVEEPAQAADTPTTEPTQAAADTPGSRTNPGSLQTHRRQNQPRQRMRLWMMAFNSGDTAELTLEEEESATPTPETTGQIIIKGADGTEKTFNSLQDAINSAPTVEDVTNKDSVTQIYLKGVLKISATVEINEKEKYFHSSSRRWCSD